MNLFSKSMSVESAIASLKKNGYGIVSRFISPEVCQKAIKEIDRLIMEFEPTEN